MIIPEMSNRRFDISGYFYGNEENLHTKVHEGNGDK